MTSSDDDQAALRLVAARNASLCTIVGIEGSFSRRLGAQIAIAEDGAIAGSLADGCLERELAAQAEQARREGVARLLRYGRGSPLIDFRLPCGSGLDILVDPAPDRAAAAEAVALLDARCLAEFLLPAAANDLLRCRRYLPQLRLVALGSGPEIDALAALATAYPVLMVTSGPDRGLSLGQQPVIAADPWTAIVLLFHDHDWEREVLEWALATPAFYIGALGGELARHGRLEWLKAQGYDGATIRRVRSPVGLIPRARDASVLALSVLADVVAAYEALRA
jgi:xanthine dehydrogenase accessory factor